MKMPLFSIANPQKIDRFKPEKSWVKNYKILPDI